MLFSVCGNAQTDVVKENLEKQVRSTLENYLEISKNLLLVKNTRVDDKLIYKIQNSKSEIEVKNLLFESKIGNIDNIYSLLEKENQSIQMFFVNNITFYNLDLVTKQKMFDEVFGKVFLEYEKYFMESLGEGGLTDSTISRVDCVGAYRKAYARCSRNFAVSGTGAVLTAAFNPIAGFIVGGVACANLYNCRSDAYVDCQDCMNN